MADLGEFFRGNLEISLSQENMARAVEFWLNSRVMAIPVKVVKMTESRVNTRSTFEIILEEMAVPSIDYIITEGDKDVQI